MLNGVKNCLGGHYALLLSERYLITRILIQLKVRTALIRYKNYLSLPLAFIHVSKITIAENGDKFRIYSIL